MSTNNPMSFFSENVDAWGPLEWFDRLVKAVQARSQAVRDKDDIAFETYKNIASSSATRLVSDFEDKVRMALTTLRELEKANVAYVDANTKLLTEIDRLKRENEALKIDASNHAADAETVRRERETERRRAESAEEALIDCLRHLRENFKDNDSIWVQRARATLASTGGEQHGN